MFKHKQKLGKKGIVHHLADFLFIVVVGFFGLFFLSLALYTGIETSQQTSRDSTLYLEAEQLLNQYLRTSVDFEGTSVEMTDLIRLWYTDKEKYKPLLEEKTEGIINTWTYELTNPTYDLGLIEAGGNVVVKSFDVIVGSGNLSADKISNMCVDLPNFVVHHQVSNMAELIADSDFSIGAGGATTWERCFLGLPSATIIVAPNQSEATVVLDGLGATWNLGWHENVTEEMIAKKIKEVCTNPDALLRMRNLAFKVMEKTEKNNMLSLCEIMFKLNNT